MDQEEKQKMKEGEEGAIMHLEPIMIK